MYLLGDNPAPDYNTVARFRAERLRGCEKELLEQFVAMLVEWTLLSLAYNALKLHHKVQKRRLGTGLVVPKGFPAGL